MFTLLFAAQATAQGPNPGTPIEIKGVHYFILSADVDPSMVAVLLGGGEVTNEINNPDVRVSAEGENANGDTVVEPVLTGENSKDKGIVDCDNFVVIKRVGKTGEQSDYVFWWADLTSNGPGPGGNKKAVVREKGKPKPGERKGVWTPGGLSGGDLTSEQFNAYMNKYWHNH